MILKGWTSDAERLMAELPPSAAVTERVGFLIGAVLSKGIEVDPAVFDTATDLSAKSLDSFLVVNRQELAKGRSNLAKLALMSPGVAFVKYAPNMPSVMALSGHDPTTPKGNALTILHESEHITDKAEGRFRQSLGARERHAYALNAQTLAAIDGSDFQAYIDKWPATFTRDAFTTEIEFHDMECPEPGKETYAHDVWVEGGNSRQVLRSIGRVTVLEQLAAQSPQHVIDQLVGNGQLA